MHTMYTMYTSMSVVGTREAKVGSTATAAAVMR